MKNDHDLFENIDKLHTTELGRIRIKKNLSLSTEDVVDWCRDALFKQTQILRKGKNWYVYVDNYILTINAYSYTIITAHLKKGSKSD